ncbi:endonuclease VIII [Oceanirhabdus sp. W0125-5]|uniref:endonuclease VIII n=1 Tax=Oceanirhabdus sp. W0125-5 TaxID=2999116 RepID=UPI0022F2F058|nr:endonuclease VIII [Oceanirhabdus sp. W0125-5]WBW96954.1 endonuclease VIII [Oceanirhabdus sp. W0125-5]
MLEIPEAKVVAQQFNETIKGKKIANVVADYSPHKFAFYFGEPSEYNKLLHGKTIGKSNNYGGIVETTVEDCKIILGDGVRLIYGENGDKVPCKHQLLLNFTDGSFLASSVQMYGGMWCFRDGENDNPYHKVAKVKPSPLSSEFDEEYFKSLISEKDNKLSVKAFLATKQRIPGLGNGVLQDILWKANINPRTKMNLLEEERIKKLFLSIKNTLKEMTENGGRDTEKDIFGIKGRYETVMSSKNKGKVCPVCGEEIIKEAYLGGSVYYCAGCQYK